MGVLGIPQVMCDPEMSAPQVVPFSFGIIGALRATFYDLYFFLVWASSDMSLKCFEAHKLTSAARAIPASTEHFPYEQYSLIFVIDAHINVTAR